MNITPKIGNTVSLPPLNIRKPSLEKTDLKDKGDTPKFNDKRDM